MGVPKCALLDHEISRSLEIPKVVHEGKTLISNTMVDYPGVRQPEVSEKMLHPYSVLSV